MDYELSKSVWLIKSLAEHQIDNLTGIKNLLEEFDNDDVKRDADRLGHIIDKLDYWLETGVGWEFHQK